MRELPIAYNQTRRLRALFINYNKGLMAHGLKFNGLHWLNKLSLSNNSLTHLLTNNFLGLANLQVLDLSYNLLDAVDSAVFNSLVKLKSLDLSHNALVNLGQDSFSQLMSLERLKIENNPTLDNVHVSTFSQVKLLNVYSNI